MKTQLFGKDSTENFGKISPKASQRGSILIKMTKSQLAHFMFILDKNDKILIVFLFIK